MFAVIKTGGKQYKVSAGDILKIERLAGDAGHKVDFQDIFMVGDDKSVKIGTPNVAKALVKATVLEQARGDKIIVYKKKRRQGYDRKNGHRQDLSVIHIDEILEGGKSLAKAERQVKKAAPKKVAEATKPVVKKKAAAAPEKKKPTATKKATTAVKKPAAAKKTSNTKTTQKS